MMKRGKKKSALLALVLILLLLGGCAAKEEKERARRLIYLGGIQYTYGDLLDAEAETRAYYDQMNMVYAMYGIPPVEVTEHQIRDEAFNNLALQAVILEKAASVGLDQLTAAEKAELTARTDAAMAEYRAAAAAGLPENLTGQEREAAIDAALAAAGVTRERVYRAQREAFIIEKAEAWATAGVSVTDEEFMAAFNAQVEQDRTSMLADPDAYGYGVLTGQRILYVPAGYREVDWLVIGYGPEDAALIAALTQVHGAAHEDVHAAEAAVRGLLGENVDIGALLAQVQVTLSDASNPMQIVVQETVADFVPPLADDAAAAVMALANAHALEAAYAEQLALAYAAANENIAPEVAEALRRLENGESWPLVQQHYNDDTGMSLGSPLVRAGFAYAPAAFVDAAMALEAPGDYASLYMDGTGCVILWYTADVQEGPVDPATVREGMMAELLAHKREESFNSTLSIWVDAASPRMIINYNLLEH